MVLTPFFIDFPLLLRITHGPVLVQSRKPFAMANAGGPKLAPALYTTSGGSPEICTCNVHQEWPHAPLSDGQILGSAWTPRTTRKAVSFFVKFRASLLWVWLTINTTEIGGGCMVSSLLTPQADGVDCTAIQGISDVSCFRGQCVVHQCVPGYEPNSLEDSCIEAPPNVLFTAHDNFWEGRTMNPFLEWHFFRFSLFEWTFSLYNGLSSSCYKPPLCNCLGIIQSRKTPLVHLLLTLRDSITFSKGTPASEKKIWSRFFCWVVD